MFKFFTAGLIWSGMLLSSASYGQYEQIPLGAQPMAFNSSFAGEAQSPRLTSNFLYEDAKHCANCGPLYGLSASYDQFIPAIRSGIGFSAFRRDGSSNVYKFHDTQLSIAIAPKISFEGKYTLSPSLDLTYHTGSSLRTDYPEYSTTYTRLRSRAALLFNTHKWYIGYSIILLNRETFKGMAAPSAVRFDSFVQAGYTFQRSTEAKFSFTPQVAVAILRENGPRYSSIPSLVRINLMFRYKQVIWGGDSDTGLILGWQTERLRLMASSNLGRYRYDTQYSGSLSFRYIFKQASQ